MRKTKENQKGISLIVLVITIIVMIILAASVILAFSNSGLLNKAKDVVDATNLKQVQVAANVSWLQHFADGQRDNTLVQSVIADLKEATGNDNIDRIYNIVISNNGIVVSVRTGNEEEERLQLALANFAADPDAYTHEDQSATNLTRAIGPDGLAVNTDLWDISIVDENEKTAGLIGGVWTPAYKGEFSDEDRTVHGSVPQYVKFEDKEGIYTIVDMSYCFCNTYMTEAPTIPNTVTNMEATFMSSWIEVLPVLPDSVTNTRNMFNDCRSLDDITIEYKVLGDEMFYQCYSLSKVVLSDKIEAIGEHVFHASSVSDVTIQCSVLGDCMFSDCWNLTNITIPSCVVEGEGALAQATSLQNVTIETSKIFKEMFAWSGLSELVIPNCVTEIGRSAFSQCGLESITFSENLVEIGALAFYENSLLSEIVIPDKVENIDRNAFSGCILESVTIPSSVKNLGAGAFSYNGNLSVVKILSEDITIGNGAFANIASDADIYVLNDDVASALEGNCPSGATIHVVSLAEMPD